jgi:hypothetical protein
MSWSLGAKKNAYRRLIVFSKTIEPEHLVVCCRQAEYQNFRTKLQLNGAISMRPLADEQIHNYLAVANHPALWNIVQADPTLSELARSPLLLSMLTLAYEARSIPEWRTSSFLEGHHQYLLDVVYSTHAVARD